MIQRLGEPSEALRHVPPPFSREEMLAGTMGHVVPWCQPCRLRDPLPWVSAKI